jgi:TRAP-type C4-dicarboxylate transport system substrate-binding protein
MARALGASAFVKPAPESYELLSSGVADGTFFPLESIVSFKLGSVIKYATLFPGGFYGSAFGFFMNEDKWNQLSKADQDAITSVSGESLARLAGKAWDAADAEALAEMKRIGIQIKRGFAGVHQGSAGESQEHSGQMGQGRHCQGNRWCQGACRLPRRG